MIDITAYLQLRRLKLTTDPFNAAIALAAKGRRVVEWLEEQPELPEDEQ